MTAFHYTAIDATGKKQKGIIEAEHAKMARQLLRHKNLTPLDVTPAQQKTPHLKNKFWRPRHRLSAKELALITRQLATLLSAGMPIEEVLSAVAEQTEHHRTQGLILSVRNKVLSGHSLASALRDHAAFSNLYCSTVAAGEKSGHLDKVLQRLADYTEQQYAVRQKILQALIYPSIMILVSIGIVGFLLEFVVPKMIAVYSSTSQNLPLITRFLISLSSGIHRYGLIIFIILIIVLFFFFRLLKNNLSFKEKVHAFLLRLPVFGNTIKIINTARFSRTLAILSSAGVTLLDAMSIASQLITNIPIQKAVKEAAEHVREGAAIHLSLRQTQFFPPMSIHLIASGEASGQLEAMLERAATNQENDITRLIDTSLSLFEPLLIVIMGGIVLFIVLAVLLPIFQLNQFMG